MLNIIGDVLEILDCMCYLKDVMNQLFLVVASLILYLSMLNPCGNYDFNLLTKTVLYCYPLWVGK